MAVRRAAYIEVFAMAHNKPASGHVPVSLQQISRTPKERRMQSRTMALVAAVANVMVGFMLAMLTQAVAFPLLGIEMSTSDKPSGPCRFF